jgi:hypothetical protein
VQNLGAEFFPETVMGDESSDSQNCLRLTCELVASAYESRPRIEDLVDVVTTGAGIGAGNRTTGVVVEELFRKAQQSVLVEGYSVYQGNKVFQGLADGMQKTPELAVRLFLDIQRRQGNTSAPLN